ncbi:mucin-binding protein [Lapidilactobacillus salsurivasis]
MKRLKEQQDTPSVTAHLVQAGLVMTVGLFLYAPNVLVKAAANVEATEENSLNTRLTAASSQLGTTARLTSTTEVITISATTAMENGNTEPGETGNPSDVAKDSGSTTEHEPTIAAGPTNSEQSANSDQTTNSNQTNKPDSADPDSTDATDAGVSTTETPNQDAEVVQFGDENLSNYLKNSVFTIPQAEPITLKIIKQYSRGKLTIKPQDDTSKRFAVTSLQGLEAFQYLPEQVKLELNLDLSIPTSGEFSFDPLKTLRPAELTLNTPMWGRVSDESLSELKNISVERLDYLALSGFQLNRSREFYQANTHGLTNRQLGLLATWIKGFAENHVYSSSYKSLDLQNNSLSDFSSLGIIDPNQIDAEDHFWIKGLAQCYLNREKKLNFVIGQPGEFDMDDLIGIDGKPMNLKAGSNGDPVVPGTVGNESVDIFSYNTANGESTALEHLGSASSLRYRISAANQLPNSKMFMYYQKGIYGTGLNSIVYPGYYNNKIEIEYDAAIYYNNVNWQAHPQVTVNFVDEAGKVIHDSMTLGDKDTKIGDVYDATAQQGTQIAGYTFEKVSASSLTGTYQQDPQSVNLTYQKDGSNVTETGQIIVDYLDQTTDATIASEKLSGEVGAAATYATADKIAALTKAGYQLVTDDFPANATFAEMAQHYQVTLKHSQQAVQPQIKTVTRMIQFQYATGKTAAPTQTQQVVLARSGAKDLVSGDITWDAWAASNGAAYFAAVTVPKLSGVTASLPQVPRVEPVTAATADTTVTVAYTASGSAPDLKPEPTPSPDSERPTLPVTGQKTADPTSQEQPTPTLPQTNETRSTLGQLGTVLAGLSLMVLGAVWLKKH